MTDSNIEAEYARVFQEGMVFLEAGDYLVAIGCFQSFLDAYREQIPKDMQLRCMRWLATIYEQAGQLNDAAECYAAVLQQMDASHESYITSVLHYAKLLTQTGLGRAGKATIETLFPTFDTCALMDKIGLLRTYSQILIALELAFPMAYFPAIDAVAAELALVRLPVAYDSLPAPDRIAFLYQQHHASNRRYGQMILAVSAMDSEDEKRTSIQQYAAKEPVGYYANMALELLQHRQGPKRHV